MKKDIKGNCGICGEYKKLSFEHVPPEKAFNQSPVYIQNHNSLFEESSPYYGTRRRLNQGFGDYTLCVSCNNNTGDWYGRDYIEWAYQGMYLLLKNKGISRVICPFTIKPLNVLKQIMSFFLTADKAGIYQSNHDIVKFILEKENTFLPDRYKVYLYLNNSKTKRLHGYQVVYDPSLPCMCKWAEVSFRPFGFLLCDDSPPANQFQLDITFFKNYSYDSSENIRLPLHYLEIEDFQTGKYSNVK